MSGIAIIASVLLVIFTIMLNAYWAEMNRCADSAVNASDAGKEEEAKVWKKNKHTYERTFRILSGLTFLVLLSVILPTVKSSDFILRLSMWLLVPPVVVSMFFFLKYALGFYPTANPRFKDL